MRTPLLRVGLLNSFVAKSLALSLAIGAVALGGVSTALAVEQQQKISASATLTELSSAKSVRYKLANGPWVTSSPGETLAAMPLDLRTGEVPCRVKIEEVGYLQVLGDSDVQVSLEGKELTVKVSKGGLLYGLYEQVSLKAVSEQSTVLARAGGPAEAKDSAQEEMFASMGLIRLIPSAQPSLEVSNIKGQATLVNGAAPAIDLAVGQTYRSENGQVALVQANLDTAARPVAPEAVSVQGAPASVSESSTGAGAGAVVPRAKVVPADVQRILIQVLPGATDDVLSQIAPPHLEASPWSPPARNRGPLPTRRRLP